MSNGEKDCKIVKDYYSASSGVYKGCNKDILELYELYKRYELLTKDYVSTKAKTHQRKTRSQARALRS